MHEGKAPLAPAHPCLAVHKRICRLLNPLILCADTGEAGGTAGRGRKTAGHDARAQGPEAWLGGEPGRRCLSVCCMPSMACNAGLGRVSSGMGPESNLNMPTTRRRSLAAHDLLNVLVSSAWKRSQAQLHCGSHCWPVIVGLSWAHRHRRARRGLAVVDWAAGIYLGHILTLL